MSKPQRSPNCFLTAPYSADLHSTERMGGVFKQKYNRFNTGHCIVPCLRQVDLRRSREHKNISSKSHQIVLVYRVNVISVTRCTWLCGNEYFMRRIPTIPSTSLRLQSRRNTNKININNQQITGCKGTNK